jgi:DNA-binding response OmpR family regulator
MAGHETILIVEEDGDLRNLRRDFLQGQGYAVLDAGTAAEAAEMSNGLKSPIDLLVVDEVLPDSRGSELADCLRETRPGLPVLYVTNTSTTAELEQSVRKLLDRHKRKRILLVDDDTQVLMFASEVLRDAGYDVLVAEDGNVVVSIVEKEPLDLVITDLVMREREGLETMMHLRKSHPTLPVVVISGAFSGHFLRSASMMGARATLAKPFSGEDLLTTVETVLGS